MENAMDVRRVTSTIFINWIASYEGTPSRPVPGARPGGHPRLRRRAPRAHPERGRPDLRPDPGRGAPLPAHPGRPRLRTDRRAALLVDAQGARPRLRLLVEP